MQFVVPERVVTHFHLREGDVVGDFGAGSGHFISVLSKAAGASGKVYAFEIQKALVERIAEMARKENFNNVNVVWCDIESKDGCKINDDALDAGVLTNVLFQFENKDMALQEIRRLIRVGGKLLVVDWTDSFGGMGPHKDVVVTEADAKALITRHGFEYNHSFPAGEHHYGLSFRAV